MKPELLLVSPLPPRVTEALKDDFVLHDYFRAKDKPGMLKDVGGKVRGYISFASAGGADAALMDATPKVEIIANWGVGFDRVDAAAAKQRDIVVTNTPYVRAGNWPKLGILALATRVNGSRLGIVGLGRIGKAAAKRAEAFDMKIAYYGRRKQKDVPYGYYDDAVKLAKNSDFLLLTCPGGPETHHLVNAEVLNAIGPEGFIINVARGSVVDEDALVAALKEKRIAGAALDVFAKEPQVPAQLMTMDNVVLQPHQSSATSATRRAMDDLVVENLRLHFAGKPVRTPV